MFKIDWKRKRWDRKNEVLERGERKILANWLLTDDDLPSPMVEMERYAYLLTMLPDKIVENLEKARLSRDGAMPMIKAGLGYEELLAAVIVDGTAVANSTTENILFPDLLMPQNFMQPGGLPGRVLRWRARGRVGVVVTAVPTLTFNFGSGTTAVTVPTVSWCKTGAIATDAVAITAAQWFFEGDVVTRTVGTAGTVFAQGYVAFPGDTAAVSAVKVGSYFAGSGGANTPSTASFDMTLAQYLAITAKWSAANASNTITGHQYMLEALN